MPGKSGKIARDFIHPAQLLIWPAHPLIAGNSHHIPKLFFFKPRAQPAVVAIHLVAGDPGARRSCRKCTCNHPLRQFRFSSEFRSVRNRSCSATLAICGPLLGKIQLAIYQCRTPTAGIAKKHANLAIFNASGSTGVLAFNADGVSAFFQEASFIDDQNCIGGAQPFKDILAQPITSLICIPTGSVQQMLNSAGRDFTHPLSQLPAVLTLTMAQ